MRKYLAHLIGLKMSDEMPPHIGRHHLDLVTQLVGPAFAKHSLTCLISLEQSLDRMKLRHSHELDSRRNRLAELTQIFTYAHVTASYSPSFEPLPLRSAS